MSNADHSLPQNHYTTSEVARAAVRRWVLPRDRLTIWRMLVIVTAVAVGIAVFGPERGAQDIGAVDWWRHLTTAFMIGLSLAGPIFSLVRSRTYRLGAGGLLALTLGLGCLVLLPPATYVRFHGSGVDNNTSIMCLYYCLPLMSLWYLAAMQAGGRISRRSFSRAAPFSERYGLFLALLWSPLGLWLMWDFYSEAFF